MPTLSRQTFKRNSGRSVLAVMLVTAVISAFIGCAEENVITPSPNNVLYTDIRPILYLKCATARCHSGNNPAAGLGLESYEQILNGSANGPVVVPGNAAASSLYRTMAGTSAPVMPIDEKLPQPLIDSIGHWIDDGLFESR